MDTTTMARIRDALRAAEGQAPGEALRQYRDAAGEASLRDRDDPEARELRTVLLDRILGCGEAVGDTEELRAALQTLLPHCGAAVTADRIPLLREDAPLREALGSDDADAALGLLLDRIRDGTYAGRYALGELVRDLVVEDLILCQISDEGFLRGQRDLWELLRRGRRLEALDRMTGELLDGRETDDETYLRLYVSLAAVEQHGPAFVYGKRALAGLFRRQGREEELAAELADLREMGAEEDPA